MLGLPLGSVERLQERGIVDGELDAAAAGVDWCRRGHDLGAVERAEVAATQPQIELLAVAERLADGDAHASGVLGVGDDEPVGVVAAIFAPVAGAAPLPRRCRLSHCRSRCR